MSDGQTFNQRVVGSIPTALTNKIKDLSCASRSPLTANRILVTWLVTFRQAAGARRSKLQHFDDVVASLSLKLTPEEIATLEEPYTPRPSLGGRLRRARRGAHLRRSYRTDFGDLTFSGP
jgi:hypothetical protein